MAAKTHKNHKMENVFQDRACDLFPRTANRPGSQRVETGEKLQAFNIQAPKKPQISNINFGAFLVVAVVVSILLSGCANTSTRVQYPTFVDGVDIAANNGSNFRDLKKLEEALIFNGVPCRDRAISLNRGGIVVERANFDHAKTLATNIIIKKKLSACIYKSPDFKQEKIGLPSAATVELWEKGQKTGEGLLWKVDSKTETPVELDHKK